MGELEAGDARDAALWKLFSRASGRPAGAGETDANALAAYLDGTCRPEEAEALERAMAADRELLDALVELREVLAARALDAPEGLRERIRTALAPCGGPSAGVRARSRLAALRARSPWWLVCAAAAAAVFVSLLGYDLGRDSVGANGIEGQAAAEGLLPETAPRIATQSLLGLLGRSEAKEGGPW